MGPRRCSTPLPASSTCVLEYCIPISVYEGATSVRGETWRPASTRVQPTSPCANGTTHRRASLSLPGKTIRYASNLTRTTVAHWIRYRHRGEIGFGTLDGEIIREHSGDMFATPRPSGRAIARAEVELLAPTSPSKII
ncbi:MAG: DUF2437 domain-containing protein, partial [Bradyrhizobium sp.]